MEFKRPILIYLVERGDEDDLVGLAAYDGRPHGAAQRARPRPDGGGAAPAGGVGVVLQQGRVALVRARRQNDTVTTQFEEGIS